MKTQPILPTLALVAISLLVPTAGQALELFVGGALGNEVESGAIREGFEGLDPDAEDAGYKLFAGVTLTRLLGAELAYYDFGAQSCCAGAADIGFASEVDGVAASLIVGLPLPVPRLHVYGKLGILDWDESGTEITIAETFPVSASGTDLLLGVGVRVRLTDSFGLRAEWERFTFEDESSDGVWAGAELRFF